MKIPRIMISAPSSGSGKSMVATGLMAAFSQSLKVRGFKVGPDFIDPMYHAAATGVPSINLDSWMLSSESNLSNFILASEGMDLAIIEGVMGLFDGRDSDPFCGSSAELARLTQTPVILVLDSSKLSGTAAAIVSGLSNFDPRVKIAGIICNRVGSKRHATILRKAIEKHAGMPVFGCLPKLPELEIPSRHLGLFPVHERPEQSKLFIAQACEIVQTHLDLQKILELAKEAPELYHPAPPIVRKETQPVRIGIARDEAFCFYYEDNLKALQNEGGILVPFSPLKDRCLPEGIQGLYLGGGYVDLYAEPLTRNEEMLSQIRTFCDANRPVYAEGTAFVYLSEEFQKQDNCIRMLGVIPGYCEPSPKLRMGYREINLLRDTVLAKSGVHLRGHEFHYCHWNQPKETSFAYLADLHNDLQEETGWANGNLLASFFHLHFSQDKALSKTFVEKCRDH
jgi:cobyrinic acid a,c-diamide synthase